MAYIDFMSVLHKSTKRDYLARVNELEFPKAKAAKYRTSRFCSFIDFTVIRNRNIGKFFGKFRQIIFGHICQDFTRIAEICIYVSLQTDRSFAVNAVDAGITAPTFKNGNGIERDLFTTGRSDTEILKIAQAVLIVFGEADINFI